MLADISGFTALGEQLDAEEVVSIINGCFQKLEQIVHAHGGTIDEYLGDCVKAAFGLGINRGEGALEAVAAAVEMRNAVDAYNQAQKIQPPLGLHVGLSTGPVAAVPVHSGSSSRTCVVGEAARTASVLEDASERGQIFVDAETLRETEDRFRFRGVDREIEVEGFELLEEKPRGHPKRNSERRVATLLFADLIGAETLAADEADLETKMSELLELLRQATIEHEGDVTQYTGDGVLALYGIPNAIEDAPKQAINAALRMREMVRQHASAEGASLSIHVGINTGPVVAGEIGGKARRTYTGVGDTVNTAARIKDAAPADEIYVGEETWRQVRGGFDFDAPKPMDFKGKAAPVSVYRLASEARRIHRSQHREGRRRIFSLLVGREEESRTLTTLLDRLAEGGGGAISIIGEAGLGKTRLVSECIRARDAARIRFLSARSLSMGASLSYHPFVDMIRVWAGISDEDMKEKALGRLDHALRSLSEEASASLPFLATLIGLDPGEEDAARLAQMDGDAIERLVTKSLRDLVAAIARERPTMILLEDVHWADRSSIDLLGSLLPLAHDLPLLFCFLMRPGFPETGEAVRQVAGRELEEKSEVLELPPLPPRSVEDLVGNLLQSENLPKAVPEAIREKAGGNPFFVEEVVGALIDGGAVALQDGRYRVTDEIEHFHVPSSVQEVILDRIDRLDETKRNTLQIASVIGRSFSENLLRDLLDEKDRVEADLQALCELDILTQTDPGLATRSTAGASPDREYTFRHALGQDTIYESLLVETRKKFHGRIAEAIERRYSDRAREFYDRLAYHTLRAEVLTKAEDYSFRAGLESARSGAPKEALEYFLESSRLDSQIRGARGDPDHREQIEKNIGLSLLTMGHLTESLPHFDGAMSWLGERVPATNFARQYRFVRDFGSVLSDLLLTHRIRPQRAGSARDHEFFEILNARARAGVTSDPRRILFDNIGGVRRVNRIHAMNFPPSCAMYAVAGGMFSFSGLSLGLARRFLERARECREKGNLRDEFDCQHLQFVIGYLGGDWDDQSLLPPDILEDMIQQGLFWDLQTYLGLACNRLSSQGRFAEANEHLQRLAHLRDAYDFEFAADNFDGESAILALERRDLPKGLDACERYLEGRNEAGLRVHALGIQGKLLFHAGDRGRADAALAEGEAVCASANAVPPWHASTLALAQLARDVERFAETTGADRHQNLSRARRSRQQALRLTRTVASQRTEALRLSGTLAWLEGRRRRARNHWQDALHLGESLGARPELARTRAAIARHLDPGMEMAGASAHEHLRRAREEFTALDLHWDLAKLQDPTVWL